MNFVGPLMLLCLLAIPLLYQTGLLGQLQEKVFLPRGKTSPKQRPPVSGGNGNIKMIIITDAGVDDADAVILGLSHQKVDVLAIVAVYGNVFRDRVIINVNRVLRLYPEQNVPIYAGSEVPMGSRKGYKHKEQTYHGADGLGERPDVFPELLDSDKIAAVPGKEAYDAIFEIINDNPGTVIVCVGPLTDLALAIRKYPKQLPGHKNLERVYMLGGNIPVPYGTPTKVAINLREDALATAIVVGELQRPITFIAREAYSGLNTSKAFEDKFMNFESTHVGRFVKAIRKLWLVELHGPSTIFDEVAMAAAIDRSVIENSEIAKDFVRVAVDEKFKGQIVIDEQPKGEKADVEFVTRLNWREIEKMLVQSLEHKTIMP